MLIRPLLKLLVKTSLVDLFSKMSPPLLTPHLKAVRYLSLAAFLCLSSSGKFSDEVMFSQQFSSCSYFYLCLFPFPTILYF